MKKLVYLLLPILLAISIFQTQIQAQESRARELNEYMLEGIRQDFARPTVHARNLFHMSAAMYDCWAVYDPFAETYFLDKSVDGYSINFDGVPEPADVKAAQEEAMSFAVYRLMLHRFQFSPDPDPFFSDLDWFMATKGYDIDNVSTDYADGDPAALGNYLAEQIILFGLQDNSNEQFGYANLFYEPVNDPLVMLDPGNPDLTDFNRWQPLTLDIFIDQSGNPIPFNTPDFLGPEWGQVSPFSLKEEDRTVFERDGFDYHVYHDPGPPPFLDTTAVGGLSEEYKWNFAMVSVWSAHCEANDVDLWDISPNSIGNIPVDSFPTTIEGLRDFYNFEEGGDISQGREMNPKTGLPYDEQWVPRGDYARVLAEFWADGPDSETPPGHWYVILNYVMDHPAFEKRYRGEGPILDELEYDVKAYFALGGTMHDVAITAWGIKGWYDYIRPVSALRGMAELGQSTSDTLPSYHPGGIPLVPGYIELVDSTDLLVGDSLQNLNKIKLLAWRGPNFIGDPLIDEAGVGWILAENWWPYQRPSFVTPPFAGYVSGHSTYSRAAAELMTLLTGDEYFPGGMGEFIAPQNEFLVFEDGPSMDVVLQWATYRDASDQCSLSRIWGGIHPPADDVPGRLIGLEIGVEAFHFAESYFFKDEDGDGFINVYDCDDLNPEINPDAIEICDNIDNDCDGMVDDSLTITSYFVDSDGDGFGDASAASLDTCLTDAPTGYVANNLDCDDANVELNPDATEVCDGIDNDCNGMVDDSLTITSYYVDADDDGFGDASAASLDTCLTDAPTGYVANNLDCDDANAELNPDAAEVCDGIDNNCDGMVDEGIPIITIFLDEDGDGFGTDVSAIDTCADAPPANYVLVGGDCDDLNAEINPDAMEVYDSLDNDCNGLVDDGVSSTNEFSQLPHRLYPNPTTDLLVIEYGFAGEMSVEIFRVDGRCAQVAVLDFTAGQAVLSLENLPQGVYLVQVTDQEGRRHFVERIVVF